MKLTEALVVGGPTSTLVVKRGKNDLLKAKNNLRWIIPGCSCDCGNIFAVKGNDENVGISEGAPDGG